MKSFFFALFSCFSLVIASYGQTVFYKYQSTVNSEGVKLFTQRTDNVVSGYYTFYNNRSKVSSSDKNGIASDWWFSYEKTNNGIHMYSGPHDGKADYVAIFLPILYGGKGSETIIYYFSSDYSRMNIKLVQSNTTYVLVRGEDPEEHVPGQLY